MTDGVSSPTAMPESQFAALVDELAADPDRHPQLVELLRENHALYTQRSTAATVRMRGWLLLALARTGLTDAALVFVLEDLETGNDPYLVAAAARALRSYRQPRAAFARFILSALRNIRYREEPVSFDTYGAYAEDGASTTPVRELLATLAWLGREARPSLPEIEQLRSEPGALPRKLLCELDRTIEAIRGAGPSAQAPAHTCCMLPESLRNAIPWTTPARQPSEGVERTVFEDHDGAKARFDELFCEQPSIVVFFYTRCDNPHKCSLTITKLARIQALLEQRKLGDQVRIAAITYDPAFDSPDRMRGYAQNRGVRLDKRNRMLRAVDHFETLRDYFHLGVNFVGSLVNRHRLEVYLLDASGRIAASFERLHWDEDEVVEQASRLLNEEQHNRPEDPPTPNARRPRFAGSTALGGTVASVAIAFFPKCPLCWAAYMSMFGIAGLERIPYTPWLQVAFAAVLTINLVTLWFRARTLDRMAAFGLAFAGAFFIILSRLQPDWENAAVLGIGAIFTGSLLGALPVDRRLFADRLPGNPVNPPATLTP